MVELRSLYDTDIQQRQPDLYTPRETPLATIDPDNIAKSKQQLPTSPIVSGVEERLKAEGSNTSTLSHITAWLGAAKGDFRGIQAIEDSKRRTALAKSMVPEMTRVNKLIQTGKWEEASEFVNELAGSYGTRAEYLVPYFQQMQADIKKKQEGWQTLKAVRDAYVEAGVTEGQPNYPILKALNAAVEKRDIWSETSLQGFLTRSAPHIQNIDGRITQTQPLTGRTTTEQLPAVTKASDVDDYIGNVVGGRNNVTPRQIADIINGVTVTTPDGKKITPDSMEGRKIKEEYNVLLPIKADLELAKSLPIDPAITLQAIKQSGRLNTARRVFGDDVDAILDGQMNRITKQKIAETEGIVASDPRVVPSTGSITIGADPSNPNTYLKPQELVTLDDVKKSRGKLRSINLNVYDKQVVPAFSGIQTLDTIPEILKINPVETKGDVLEQGINQKISRFLGYPVTTNAEVRQEVRTRLNRAIEQAENIIVNMSGASGHDDRDIATWKAFATGDFRSNADVLKTVNDIRNRLNQVLDRAVSTTIPKPGEKAAAKSPASAIAPLIPSAKGQVTRQPYNIDGSISLPPEVDEDIAKMVLDRARKSGKGGGVTVQIPDRSKAAAPTKGAPSLQPEPPPVPSAQDRINSAIANKRLQRVR